MKNIINFNGIVFKSMSMMITVIVVFIGISLYFGVQSSISISESKNTLHSEFLHNTLEQIKENSVKRKFKTSRYLRKMMELSFLYAKDSKVLQKEIMNVFMQTEGIISFQAISDNGTIVISGYKENNKVIYSNIIPSHIIKNAILTINSYPSSGLKFYGHYNINSFTSRISENNEIYQDNFGLVLEEVENMQKGLVKVNVLRFATSLLLSLIVLFLIIKMMIKNPLNKINNQIYSFFEKLKNNESSIDSLNLNSNNELGLISKFLDNQLQDILTRNNKMRLEKNNTNSTIESTKLIQRSLIPKNSVFDNCFRDYFIYFKSKDIIGGDIYFFNEISKNKFLLMCIDCTGHNISGAFVSVCVSIIEYRLIKKLKSKQQAISPAKILKYFNKELKLLFDDKDLTIGFDGGVIYFDGDKQIIKYAGANIPLYYSDDDKTIKSLPFDKYSVGYKKCDMDYKYSEYEIIIKNSVKIYITTDGFIDQIGGDQGLRFGKTRFIKMLEKNLDKPFKKQMEIYHQELESYKNNEHQIDDITFMAMICDPSKLNSKITINNNIFYHEYEGRFSNKNIIKLVSDVEEKLITHKASIGISKKVIISIIEIAQNISKYSKNTFSDSHIPHPDMISIKKDSECYTISSLNIINAEDEVVISDIINKIQVMEKDKIRKHYNHLRKSGDTVHSMGSGIGFFQIATKCNKMDYAINNMPSNMNLMLNLIIKIKGTSINSNNLDNVRF